MKKMLAIKNDCKFMGMWQLWTASSVIGCRIRSVCPMRGSEAFRIDFNRIVVPINELSRHKQSLSIMWTPIVENGQIIHFVALLESLN